MEETFQKKELPTRSTRGKRLTSIVDDEAAAADEEFYNQAYFQEAADDAQFELGEEEEDVVDADFDDPENEDVAESDEEVGVERKKHKQVYVDPKGREAQKKEKRKKDKEKSKSTKKTAPTTPSASTVSTEATPITPDSVATTTTSSPQVTTPLGKRGKPTPVSDRTVRASTQNLTKERTKERKRATKEQQRKRAERAKRKSTVQKVRLTQEELLEEAKWTEQYNRESLAYLQAIEEERKRLPSTKPRIVGPIIQFYSKDGKDVVTFPDASYLSQFSGKQSPNSYPTRAICPISGLPAKYVDPVTGTPYATAEAFTAIREQSRKSEEAKLDEKLVQLTALLEERKKQKDELNSKKLLANNQTPNATTSMEVDG